MKTALLSRKNQRGSALVEMAFGMTLLFTILIGVLDYGPLFYNAIKLDSGARAGAIYGSQSVAHSADIEGMRSTALANMQNVNSVTVTPTQFCKCPGDTGTRDCDETCPNGAVLMIYAKVVTQWSYLPSFRYPRLAEPRVITRTAMARAQ